MRLCSSHASASLLALPLLSNLQIPSASVLLHDSPSGTPDSSCESYTSRVCTVGFIS